MISEKPRLPIFLVDDCNCKIAVKLRYKPRPALRKESPDKLWIRDGTLIPLRFIKLASVIYRSRKEDRYPRILIVPEKIISGVR